jgi:hypothetical protein
VWRSVGAAVANAVVDAVVHTLAAGSSTRPSLRVVNVVVGVAAVDNPVANTVSFAALGAGSTALVWGFEGCPRVAVFGRGVSVASFRIEV